MESNDILNPELVEKIPSIDLEITNELGNPTKEVWEHTELHCPSCGIQSVWMQKGPSDYYEGAEYLCSKCESSFTMPHITKVDSVEDKQRLEGIKKFV